MSLATWRDSFVTNVEQTDEKKSDIIIRQKKILSLMKLVGNETFNYVKIETIYSCHRYSSATTRHFCPEFKRRAD